MANLLFWLGHGTYIMSLFNSIMDKTIGLRWRLQGLVSPFKLADIEAAQQEDIRRAKGQAIQRSFETVRQAEVRHEKEVKRAQAESVAEVNNVLRADNAHPDQVDLLGFLGRSKFKTYALLGLTAVALGAGGFLVLQVVRLFRK